MKSGSNHIPFLYLEEPIRQIWKIRIVLYNIAKLIKKMEKIN